MKTLTKYLNEVRQRADAATKGPWTHRSSDFDPDGFVEAREEGKPYGQEILGDEYFPELDKSKDCVFIAHARQDVETLLEIVRLQDVALKHAYPCGTESASLQFQAAIAALLKESK